MRAVQERELPEANDDWAVDATGFASFDELKADVRARLERIERLEQGVAARDKVLEELLAAIDIPLPESVVEAETTWRRRAAEDQLSRSGGDMAGYLESEGKTADEFEAELLQGARDAVKAQLVLDAIADTEQLGVSEAELTDQVVRRAQRAGLSPDAYAQNVVESGQLQGLIQEVRRGKALATVMESATIVDTAGTPGRPRGAARRPRRWRGHRGRRGRRAGTPLPRAQRRPGPLPRRLSELLRPERNGPLQRSGVSSYGVRVGISDEPDDDRQAHPVSQNHPTSALVVPSVSAAPQARGAGMGMGLDDQVFNRLLKERIIFMGTAVDDPMANAICGQLLLLAAEDPDRDIFLYINSPGGSISAGMAIYDTMQFVSNDVATVGLGLAASMGQFLLCAGAKGKRYATPHARIMMHQPSGGIGGHRGRHRDPGRADALRQEADG